MRKYLLTTLLLLSAVILPSVGVEENPILAVAIGDDDTDGISTNDVRVDIEESLVRVYGAEGMTLEVVSLTGLSVYKIKIESKAQSIELKIPKGCYIMKVGTVVRKIAIR